MPARITDQEYKALVRQKYGPDLVPMEPYINIKTSIKHKCTKCGDVRDKMPMLVLSHKTTRGKVLCCYQLPSTESYIAELRAINATLVPIAPYLGRHKKSLHRCTVCNTEREMRPTHILHGHGCFVCAKEKQRYGHFKKKNVKVGGVCYTLQGFEPQALRYMINMGAKPRNIISEVKLGKPTIQYRFEGKEKTFIPDFFHKTKNRIVEVKSVWTLGLSLKVDGGPFKKNKAKAKATIAAGYNFTLLLINKQGERIPLPQDWHTMTKAQVRKIVLT